MREHTSKGSSSPAPHGLRRGGRLFDEYEATGFDVAWEKDDVVARVRLRCTRANVLESGDRTTHTVVRGGAGWR